MSLTTISSSVRIDDEGLVNLLVAIVFVAVWALGAIASKRRGKTQQTSDHTQPEEPDLMEFEPSGSDVGPVVLPQRPEPAVSRPQVVTPVTRPVPQAIPAMTAHMDIGPSGGLVPIPIPADKLREAVLLSEIIDEPVGLRQPRY